MCFNECGSMTVKGDVAAAMLSPHGRPSTHTHTHTHTNSCHAARIAMFAPALGACKALPTASWPSAVAEQVTCIEQAVVHGAEPLEPLALQTHKPVPLIQLEPAFQVSPGARPPSSVFLHTHTRTHAHTHPPWSNCPVTLLITPVSRAMVAPQEVFTGRKNAGASKEIRDQQKLRHQHRKEFKGALRELRKDARFVASVRIDEQAQRDSERFVRAGRGWRGHASDPR